MSIDHVAITTKSLEATHSFYAEAIGFMLVRVDIAPTPGGGWMRHAFYDTGGGSLLAVIEFHDDTIGEFRTELSSGLGLPSWANHLAFGVPDLDLLESHRLRLLEHGHGCVVMDHDNTIAVYADDPNGIMIELSVWVRPFTAQDRYLAEDLLHAAAPPVNLGQPAMEFFDPAGPAGIRSDIIAQARGPTLPAVRR